LPTIISSYHEFDSKTHGTYFKELPKSRFPYPLPALLRLLLPVRLEPQDEI